MHLGGTTQFGYHTGIVLQTLGQVRRAIDAYRGALDQDPTYPRPRRTRPPPPEYPRRGRGAAAYSAEYIRITSRSLCRYAIAHYNLGVALQSQRRLDEAIRAYAAAEWRSCPLVLALSRP